MPTRRHLLAGPLALALVPLARAEEARNPAAAAFAQGRPWRAGALAIEVPPLVENGNSVPVTLSLESPMTEDDHVTALALFTEKNPQPEVAVFRLSPASGRARVSTRIRLATTQRLTAVALTSRGDAVEATAEVLVTLAACTEEF